MSRPILKLSLPTAIPVKKTTTVIVEEVKQEPQQRTPVPRKNKKHKNSVMSYSQFSEMLAYMIDKYPKCFGKPRLLAIDIHKQLIEAEKDKYSPHMIRKFLGCFCHSSGYKRKLKENFVRVDLWGKYQNEKT
jgi:hypothetical protein